MIRQQQRRPLGFRKPASNCSKSHAKQAILLIALSLPISACAQESNSCVEYPEQIPGLVRIKTMDPENLHSVDNAFLEETKAYRDYVMEADRKGYDRRHVLSFDSFTVEIYCNQNRRIKIVGKEAGIVLQTQYLKNGRVYVTHSDFNRDGISDVSQYFENGEPKYHHFVRGVYGVGETWY